jgi:hypothetical protein
MSVNVGDGGEWADHFGIRGLKANAPTNIKATTAQTRANIVLIPFLRGIVTAPDYIRVRITRELLPAHSALVLVMVILYRPAAILHFVKVACPVTSISAAFVELLCRCLIREGFIRPVDTAHFRLAV